MSNIYGDLDFEPPFANPDNSVQTPTTYKSIKVHLTASDVEILDKMLVEFISNNADFLTKEEWDKVGSIQNILRVGTIYGNQQ